MSDWVDTRPLPVDVVFGDGDHLAGSLHLQPLGAPEHPEETPLDLLNRSESFFALSLASDDVRLVAKARVAAVGVDRPLDEDFREHPLARHHSVEVRMASGHEFHGRVDIELPSPGSRPKDFLNQDEPFFALATDQRTWCLNRHQVLWVRPHD